MRCIRPTPALLKRTARHQRVLHKLHVRDLPVRIDFAPDTERARALDPHDAALVGEAAEYGDVLARPEEALRREVLGLPVLADVDEGLENGFRPGFFVGAAPRHDGCKVRVVVVERDVGCVWGDELLNHDGVGGVAEELLDYFEG